MLFSKKKLLKSLLNDAVDIHCHILPEIDDGAANLDASIALVNKYKALGYSKIVATPHTMSDYYPNTTATILSALDVLKNGLKKQNIQGIEIKATSEYMIDPDFEELIDANQKLLTYKENHILVEMSYLRESENFNEVLYKLQLKEYQPILAHPERYSFYLDNFDTYYAIKKQGVKFQLNMLALTEHYGSKIQKTAKRLLKEGMYDYIGIDTHRLEHLEKAEKIKISSKQIAVIQQLLENNKRLY